MENDNTVDFCAWVLKLCWGNSNFTFVNNRYGYTMSIGVKYRRRGKPAREFPIDVITITEEDVEANQLRSSL